MTQVGVGEIMDQSFTENTEILRQVERYVTAAMAGNDPAHDDGHVRRVVALTRQLCAAEPGVDGFRAELLAWLHDMQDDKLATNTGSDTLAARLAELQIPQADARFVLEALPYISYRKHPRLSEDVALEIRIVQDADRIDAMGAIGIARTFAYGGAKGRPLADSLAHFDEKLLRLYDLLSTDAGRALALPRYHFLQDFYRQFAWESEENG